MPHRIYIAAILVCASFVRAGAEDASRAQLVAGFERPDELAAMQTENTVLAQAQDAGVTEGKSALKVSAKAGADWASFLLPPEAIRGWDGAEAFSIDVFSAADEKFTLHFELWDAQSRDMATRCTFSAEVQKGGQSLSWDLLHARRNAKESVAWESLDESEKIQLGALAKVKFFVTPPKDRDLVFFLDNARVTKRSAAALEAERRDAESAKSRKVLFKSDFEDGNGLGGKDVKFIGNWLTIGDALKPAIEAPLGKGNDSKKALTCRLNKLADYAGLELPLHQTVVEPDGWDGAVSLRIFNGGFASFYMTYAPLWPSDITFYRADFTAPKNEWTDLTVPLDKFIYHGRRPRRGIQLEYICLVGVGPEGEQSLFQFDDFTVIRTRRENAPPKKPKAPLPAGVAYLQTFDDPADFDIEEYYPVNNRSHAFRTEGGVGADGKPLESDKSKDAGCLKLEGYQSNSEFRGGRRGMALTGAATVEFDCYIKGASDFALGGRGKSVRYRLSVNPQPAPETWTHITLACADFASPDGKIPPADSIWELTFGAAADNSPEHYVLIDNLTVKPGK